LGRNCTTIDVNPDAIQIAQESINELAQPQSNALVNALY
jgi:hypothetical protein